MGLSSPKHCLTQRGTLVQGQFSSGQAQGWAGRAGRKGEHCKMKPQLIETDQNLSPPHTAPALFRLRNAGLSAEFSAALTPPLCASGSPQDRKISPPGSASSGFISWCLESCLRPSHSSINKAQPHSPPAPDTEVIPAWVTVTVALTQGAWPCLLLVALRLLSIFHP